MKIKILLLIVLTVMFSGCSETNETNKETIKAFNAGNSIDCRTGFLETTHNVVTNTDYIYNTELMLFIKDNKAFKMSRCFSRN